MEHGTVVAKRYRIERKLGRGGMGAVYEATDLRFNARIALKIAQPSGSLPSRDEFEQRFVREAKIGHALGRLRGFVRAVDWGTLENGSLYLVMDLVPKARPLDLRSGSRRQRLTKLARAAGLVAQAHERGIVHRDIKPGNVFQGTDDSLWLGDFGLAKRVGEAASDLGNSLTMCGVGMGTPPFMPPEQFESARDVDTPVDVYALGVMLFVALTGKYPYAGKSAGQILSKQMRVRLEQQPAPRPRHFDKTIPRELDRLCARTLDLEPTQRPTAAELQRELERITRCGVRITSARKARSTARNQATLTIKLPTKPRLESRARVRSAAPITRPKARMVRLDASAPAWTFPTSRSQPRRSSSGLLAPILILLLTIVGVVVVRTVTTQQVGLDRIRATTPTKAVEVDESADPTLDELEEADDESEVAADRERDYEDQRQPCEDESEDSDWKDCERGTLEVSPELAQF